MKKVGKTSARRGFLTHVGDSAVERERDREVGFGAGSKNMACWRRGEALIRWSQVWLTCCAEVTSVRMSSCSRMASRSSGVEATCKAAVGMFLILLRRTPDPF